MADMEMLLEAERRGILPADKKEMLDEARRRGLVASSNNAQQSQQSNDAADMTSGQKLLAGYGGGTNLFFKGIQQKLAELGEGAGMVDTPTVQRITAEGMAARNDLERLKQQSGWAKTGAFLGETAPTIPIPGGVAGGVGTRATTSALAGLLQGALKFTGEGESTGQNMATGALGGAAGSLALSGVGKVINALANKVVKPNARVLGERFNIPTTLGEETQNPHFLRAETWMEKLPIIGIKGFREKQNAAVDDASKAFLSKYVLDGSQGTMGQLEANRKVVNGLYEKAKSLASSVGQKDMYIDPQNLSASAKKLLDRFPSTFKDFGDTKLEKIVTSISKETNDNGIAKISIDDANFLKQSLGEMVGKLKGQLQNPNSNVTKTRYAALSELLGSLEKDTDNWINKIDRPDIKAAFKDASDAHIKGVVKYGKIERAIDNATNAEGLFSPAKFSSWLDKTVTQEKYYGTFTKSEKEEMAGLSNILSIAKRAGQYKENPPTGARLAEPGAVMAAVGLVKTVPYAILAKTLSTTKAGKNIVLAASKLEPTDPAMAKIVNDAYQVATRAMSEAAMKPNEKSFSMEDVARVQGIANKNSNDKARQMKDALFNKKAEGK